VGYAGDQDHSWFDDAKAKANNRILEKVTARDLAGFKAVVEKNPAAVNLAWYGRLSKTRGPNDNMTALQLAARNGDLPMVQFLVEHGAELNVNRDMVGTPLIIAAKNGSLPIVKVLLEHGAAVKTPDLSSPDVWDDSPLSHAATKEIAAALIAAGADVCAMSAGGTPLHHARDRGIAELLLAHGAHVNARSDRTDDPTSLHSAIADRRLDVAALLIERGADVNATAKGETPLYYAARHGCEPIAAGLVAKGAKVNWPDSALSPLTAAVQYNREEIVRLLLEAGAIAPKYEKPTWTLLHLAASHGCGAEILEMLLKAGVPVDARTREIEPPSFVEDRNDLSRNQTPPGVGHRTPLHVAIQVGNLAAAKTLIAHGADIHAKTADGETPLSLAGWVERYRDIAGLYQAAAEFSRRMDQDRRKAVDNRNSARKVIGELLRATEKK
jgi:ankyrin repeat domain-containing protein 17